MTAAACQSLVSRGAAGPAARVRAVAAFLISIGAIFLWTAAAGVRAATATAHAECATYAHAITLPDSDLVACWRLAGEEIAMRLVHPGRVWIGVGFGRAMAGSDAVVGRLDTGIVTDVHMTGRTLESIRSDPHQDIGEASIEVRDGSTVLTFRRRLDTRDAYDVRIAASGWQPVIWAVGGAHGFGRHSEYGRAEIDFGAGLVRELGPARLLVLHAVVMVASWGLLVPILLVITRFYKVTPRQDYPALTDNPFWFRTHRLWMTVVVIASTLAAGMAAWTIGGLSLETVHGRIGAAVIALGWFHQGLSALRGTHGGPWDRQHRPRPPDQWFGDHYSMTARRRIFEAIHIPSGFLTAAAGIAAVLTGLFLFSLSWHWYAGYGAFLLVILGLSWKFTRDGRHIRTYVALWGASPQHPGNRPR
ncbi:MAG TPA: cytochrome and DOMON domain-containing protein [Xanthobacteraceae bacterium]